MRYKSIARTAIALGVLVIACPAFAQKAVFPDKVYGEGGSREVETKTLPDGTKTTTITVRDKNGTIREFHKRTEDPNLPTPVTEDHEFRDAKGDRAGAGYVRYDANGDMTWWQEEAIGEGEKRTSGTLYQRDAQGKWTHSRWDTALEKWVPVDPKDEPAEPPKNPPKPPQEGPGVIETSSGAFLGLALVFENVNQFVTVGFDGSYTRAVSPSLGVIADVQWTHGTDEGVSHSKFEAMGGLVFYESALGNLRIAPHVLGGLSRVSSDFHSMFVTSEPWTSFAIAAGIDVRARLNDRMAVQGRIDYNPTIRSGIVHNIRVGVGVWYRF